MSSGTAYRASRLLFRRKTIHYLQHTQKQRGNLSQCTNLTPAIRWARFKSTSTPNAQNAQSNQTESAFQSSEHALNYPQTQHKTENEVPEPPAAPRKISLRPLYFAIGFSVGAFFVADRLDQASDEDLTRILRQTGWRNGDSAQSAFLQVQRAKLDRALAWVRLHAPILNTQLSTSALRWWYARNDAESAAIIIIATNLVVFLAWQSKSPHVVNMMTRSFLHWPGRTASYTLLTSVFSHQVIQTTHFSQEFLV
jgi:hypothetical protein